MAAMEITVEEEQLQGLFQSDRPLARLLEEICNQVVEAEISDHLIGGPTPIRARHPAGSDGLIILKFPVNNLVQLFVDCRVVRIRKTLAPSPPSFPVTVRHLGDLVNLAVIGVTCPRSLYHSV